MIEAVPVAVAVHRRLQRIITSAHSHFETKVDGTPHSQTAACGSLPFGSLAPRTVNVVVRRDGERMTVLQEPIASLPDELKRIVEDEV